MATKFEKVSKKVLFSLMARPLRPLVEELFLQLPKEKVKMALVVLNILYRNIHFGNLLYNYVNVVEVTFGNLLLRV